MSPNTDSDGPPLPESDSPPTRPRPVSTRGMDDALPQTPKYKPLDKMYSSNETASANQQNSSGREETEQVYVDDNQDDLRVCTLVPRHRTMPQFVLPNEFMNGCKFWVKKTKYN